MQRYESLEWFKGQMEQKLRENEHKGGREHEPYGRLHYLLQGEIDELTDEIFAWPPNYNAIIMEAADVANFAMMIADNARRARDAAK